MQWESGDPHRFRKIEILNQKPAQREPLVVVAFNWDSGVLWCILGDWATLSKDAPFIT